MHIQKLNSSDPDFEESFTSILHWVERENPVLNQRVKEIVEDVKVRGDLALLEYTNSLDRRELESAQQLAISPDTIHAAWKRLTSENQELLETAAQRIRVFHEQQAFSDFEYKDELGNQLGTRSTPIQKVGVYVPGGQAAYPSTVLMTVIPAQVAGVPEIVITLPTPDDEADDIILGALHLCEVNTVFSVGGAQAIAALAFGTETVPQVDKIVGPGGQWVAAAKKQVFGPVGIESIAGPSEILVVADGTVDANWIAWDLMSQAEHDPNAQAILISSDPAYLEEVEETITENLKNSSRREIIQESLSTRGAFISCRNTEEAIHLANRVAPEHLQLAVKDADKYVDLVTNAGAIFIGEYSAEAMGDYVAGPSHVLPTFGTARYASVLGVQDFQKRSSVIKISKSGAQHLGRVAGSLADLEGLTAHAEAARIRIDGYDHNQ